MKKQSKEKPLKKIKLTEQDLAYLMGTKRQTYKRGKGGAIRAK